jgi:predicted small metal-binding protein
MDRALSGRGQPKRQFTSAGVAWRTLLKSGANDPPCKDTVMKTMTCEQLGGTCDKRLSAESWDEMVKAMTRHVMEKHPDVAGKMKKMHEEDPTKWGRQMKPKWDAAPAN